MTRLLFVGDLHYSGINPENYMGDYKEDFRRQMGEVYEIALNNDVKLILTPGDIFNSHTVAESTKLELAGILHQSPCPWWTIIGNHDELGYNLESFQRSSLRVLTEMTNRLYALSTNIAYQVDSNLRVTGTHYCEQMDVNGYGYGANWDISEFHIHLAHGMLLDHVPPFERYTLIQDAQTNADLVLCGHDHTGFGVVERSDGVIFCNPGAFMRQKASEAELNRTIQVALITIDGTSAKVELVPLKSAKPGHEVLSRKAIEEAKAREYAMTEFSALIKSKTGEEFSIDTLQLVQELASVEGMPAEVVGKCVELITKRRG